jgi:hypothetical protein
MVFQTGHYLTLVGSRRVRDGNCIKFSIQTCNDLDAAVVCTSKHHTELLTRRSDCNC